MIHYVQFTSPQTGATITECLPADDWHTERARLTTLGIEYISGTCASVTAQSEYGRLDSAMADKLIGTVAK